VNKIFRGREKFLAFLENFSNWEFEKPDGLAFGVENEKVRSLEDPNNS